MFQELVNTLDKIKSLIWRTQFATFLLLSLDAIVNAYFSTTRLQLIFQDLILNIYCHLKVMLESILQNKCYASN